jgi:glycerol-3-phosphate acyltransferase PlsY
MISPAEGAAGIVTVVLAYFVGAIPFAYLITRLLTGKDIRKLGTGHTGKGNVGARNVFVNVGKPAGVAVFVFDAAKGAGAVALGVWVLKAPPPFILAAGLAAVAGHIWPVYLRFVGGGGLATVVGVLSVLMIREVLTALPVTLVLMIVTRNVVLSVVLGLALIPFLLWYIGHPWWVVVFPLLLYAVMLVHFVPNIAAEIRKAKSFSDLVDGLLRRKGDDNDKRKKGKRQVTG